MLDTEKIQCPYCWETFELVIDPSEPHQEYIEDCFVCCRPIHLVVDIDNTGGMNIQALSEDDDIY
ncbi:CPXCG motif-containing cysteine-rich protein [Thiomicrorhabdus lithotrophica]|uniref:CPXCG motif-containing cysteine-rich protein n=1 Tax=Thiomicrorhabdus lithotrophica TaxID=2949997 RepID=A0ABY8CA79_9GAMM|nr:CPXCG motif-containing cysteine-rich protein [Thiomicrorhabdus lithotrophica]WEJ62885.1 CPXCG motif-containing cysteine-rich protein [Thiomicrorhabdus lithotrophica]